MLPFTDTQTAIDLLRQARWKFDLDPDTGAPLQKDYWGQHPKNWLTWEKLSSGAAGPYDHCLECSWYAEHARGREDKCPECREVGCLSTGFQVRFLGQTEWVAYT